MTPLPHCEDSEGEKLLPDYFGTQFKLNRTACDADETLKWKVPAANFDNVVAAIISLFQVATFEGWMEIIASAQDATNIEEQPSYWRGFWVQILPTKQYVSPRDSEMCPLSLLS